MRKGVKILLIVVSILLLVLGIGPFLVPIPPLEGLVPAEQLADPDSRFIEVEGITLHTKVMGEGEPALILLHGFGASTFSWREVMAPLAEDATVVAFDRPAFGLTERPMPGEWQGPSPYGYEVQPRLVIGLMDALNLDKAMLVGNSAGGTIATLTALSYPERVEALILVDAAIYVGGGTPAFLRPLFQTPQMRHIGPLISRQIQEWGIEFGRSAWHNPDAIPPEFWEGYEKPLKVENWDRALWELTRASKNPKLEARLDELQMPVLVITGDDDRIVPTQDSIRLAGALPNAELAILADCGHIPQEECPGPWLEAVNNFLTQ